MKFLLLLLAFPFGVAAQSSKSTINISVEGEQQVSSVILIENEKQTEYQVSDNKVVIMDSTEQPVLAHIALLYKDWMPKNNIFFFYLVPGNITLKVSTDANLISHLSVEGPQLTTEYQEKLLVPISACTQKMAELQSEIRKGGSDTTSIKQELNATISKSFETARNYIKQHPNSPLSIVALDMMGSGDPTIPLDRRREDLATLYHSLSSGLQKSEAGRQYFENQLEPLLKANK
jgi:hypothetical protein